MISEIFKNSEWIWRSDEYGENEYSEFADAFEWDGEETLLRISVCGDYALYINGEFAESNQFADYPHYKVYDEIDITKFLKKGRNRICILAWYFGKSGMRYLTPRAGIIFEVVQNGRAVLYSSRNTPSRKSRGYLSGSGKISPQLGYSVTYNAALDDDWLFKETDGFSFSDVLGFSGELFTRPTKKLCRGELRVGEIINSSETIIVDLKKEIVGLLKFSLKTDFEQKIIISYGEILENGHVKRKIDNRDFSIEYRAKCGENTYMSPMLRLAGRYLEISFEKPIELEYAGIIPQYYPAAEKKVKLAGDDEKIYEICLNTLKLCMMEHYVDCPWREQCLYAFDSRNQILAGFSAFSDKNAEYARANLSLIGKDRRGDGLLSICFPSGEDLVIPSFSLYYVISVKEYLENTGDWSLGNEVFEKIESLLSTFVSSMEDGLVRNKEGSTYWNFYDWSSYCDGVRGKVDFIANAVTVMALEAYEAICKMLDKKAKFDGITDKIRISAREHFRNENSGLYFVEKPDENPTELANSLAVLAKIATAEERTKICKMLKENELVPCSLSMKCFKYDAMLSESEEYGEAVLDEIRKTYMPMVETGTVWETAGGASDFDNAGSLCHGWSAIPIHYFDKLKKIKKRTYLFDFDGTLVDSMPTYVSTMLKILDDEKVPYESDIMKTITPLGMIGTARLYQEMGVKGTVEEIVERMQEYAFYEYENTIPPKENVVSVLKQLKDAGGSLNVLTASPHVTLDPCLKRIGIWDLFDNIWSCDDFNTTKSDVKIYKAAAEKMGVCVSDVLFLDDNFNADKTAKEAGMLVCGVYDASSDDYTDEIRSVSDFYINDFSELPEIEF